MQTFLPSWSFIHTASILDNRRLNKQIVEAYQIWSGRVPTKNHPACLMWSGYEDALLFYIETLLNEYDVTEYPTGYYWPVCPIGKKAQKDTMAWINWYSNHFNVDIN